MRFGTTLVIYRLAMANDFLYTEMYGITCLVFDMTAFYSTSVI